MRSIANSERVLLLKNSDILLYTPENEHFGIVPVEAMQCGSIVIACNSGGPLESIEHNRTGFLIEPDPKLWAQKISQILKDDFRPSDKKHFDSWLLEEDIAEKSNLLIDSNQNKREARSCKEIRANALERVDLLFSERAFGDQIVKVLNEMDQKEK